MKSLDDGQTNVCESPISALPSTIERRETEDHLLQLVAELSDNQQEVVRLKFQENLSYREIADVTGLSVSNVGFLLHTAVMKLRERMGSEATSS